MTRRILIVEDDADIRRMLADIVEDEGYTAMVAPTAESGLHMLAGIRPHLILCDLLLPGMDGVTFYERLLRLPQRPPVVFLTALGAPEVEARLQRQAPACPLLYKPIDLDTFIATINLMVLRSTEPLAGP